MKKIWNYLFGTTFRKGASLLTFLTLGSYVLGLVRDMIFSRTFGASRTLDVYNAAFIIPDLLLNIFVAGALTAAFVPVFTHLMAVEAKEEAEKVATTMLHVAPLAIIVLGIPIFFLMPKLSFLIAPGFSIEDRELLISMSRLMLLSPLIFAVSNTLGNMLVSYEKFLGYGLSPVFYNLGIIAGVPLAQKFGPMGLVYGVILGALLHLGVRFISVARSSFQLRYPIQIRNSHFMKIVKLMIPRMAGQPIEQIVFFIFTNMASTLFAGSIAMLSFARNFQSVPVSLFGISFSTAVFASLSRKAALNNRSGFLYHFWETAKALALTTGLSAIFFFFFGEFVIRFFLGGGRFSEEAVVQTGKLLSMFAFAIPAESFLHLLARSFYSLKDTWTPLLITLPGLLGIAFLAKFLLPTFSLNAMPISFFIVLTTEVIILSLLLFQKLRKLSP